MGHSDTAGIYKFLCLHVHIWDFQLAVVVKNPPTNAGDARDMGLISEFCCGTLKVHRADAVE